MASVVDRAAAVITQLRSRPSVRVEHDGLELLKPLRDCRDFGRLGELAEALSRLNPKNARVRVAYAQSLIETGRASAAIDVLRSALQLPGIHTSVTDELWGFIGRANKQIYMDAVDRATDAARSCINDAVEGYRIPFDRDPDNVWHAINLAAVLF